MSRLSIEQSLMWFFGQDLHRAHYIRLFHISDDRGFCVECTTQMTNIKHPCYLLDIADETVRRAIPRQRGPID